MNSKLCLTFVWLFSLIVLVKSFDDFESFSFTGKNDAISKPKDVHNLEEAKQASNEMIAKFMKDRKIPAMVFGLSVRNNVVHQSAQGIFDLENDVLADISGMFRMASITKTLTSLFIGTLVDAGKLKYEDSITKHLPANTLPPKYVNNTLVDITVGHLLSHTAGLHAMNMSDSYGSIIPTTSTESLKSLRNEPLYFKPGTDFVYSNYGYQVLGAIIEHITGENYINVLNKFIQKYVNPSSETQIERLHGSDFLLFSHKHPKYYKEDNITKATVPAGVMNENVFILGGWAAGGLISNVEDMQAFGNFILDAYHERPNAFLTKKTLDTIWTGRTKNMPSFPEVPFTEYGYGWVITEIPESANPNHLKHRSYRHHMGHLTGLSSFLAIYPKEEIVVVTMANKGDISGLDDLCIQIVETISDFVPKK